jgi:hypothetical protein
MEAAGSSRTAAVEERLLLEEVIGLYWSLAPVEFTVSQELLWLKHGDRSGTQRNGNFRRWKPVPED